MATFLLPVAKLLTCLFIYFHIYKHNICGFHLLMRSSLCNVCVCVFLVDLHFFLVQKLGVFYSERDPPAVINLCVIEQCIDLIDFAGFTCTANSFLL